jgi:hypothetical protein
MPGKARAEAPLDHFSPAERRLLHELQAQALRYFLDNQLAHGLFRDRQRNHAEASTKGLCSTSATGMGLMAVALAASPEHRMLAPAEARERVRVCLDTAWHRLPSDHGMLPHFVDAHTLQPVGADVVSTVDTAWLVAGALWASAFLQAAELEVAADRLYQRIDWRYWSPGPTGARHNLLVHGKGRSGHFLAWAWDRLNAETAFLYVLAVGAESGRDLSPACWTALDACYASAGGVRFPSADLGLFVSQYSLELLDWTRPPLSVGIDLPTTGYLAARANYLVCRSAADRFQTYRHFWGLSAGDGPGSHPDGYVYRCYSPHEPLDGTAHLTATLASLASCPELVLENVHAAEGHPRYQVRGRYGYSNVNADQNWVSPEVVGIDLGAVVLALENVFCHGRVRRVFQQLECVRQGLERSQAWHQSQKPFDREFRLAS